MYVLLRFPGKSLIRKPYLNQQPISNYLCSPYFSNNNNNYYKFSEKPFLSTLEPHISPKISEDTVSDKTQ